MRNMCGLFLRAPGPPDGAERSARWTAKGDGVRRRVGRAPAVSARAHRQAPRGAERRARSARPETAAAVPAPRKGQQGEHAVRTPVRRSRGIALGIDGKGDRAAARTDHQFSRRRGLPARRADRARRHDGREKSNGEKAAEAAGHRRRLDVPAQEGNATKRSGPAGRAGPCATSVGDGAQAAAWAFAISFLIFSAFGRQVASFALARNTSSPPRASTVRSAAETRAA
jgi:hypothetical protein